MLRVPIELLSSDRKDTAQFKKDLHHTTAILVYILYGKQSSPQICVEPASPCRVLIATTVISSSWWSGMRCSSDLSKKQTGRDATSIMGLALSRRFFAVGVAGTGSCFPSEGEAEEKGGRGVTKHNLIIHGSYHAFGNIQLGFRRALCVSSM